MLVQPYDRSSADSALPGLLESGGGSFENPVFTSAFPLGAGDDSIARLFPPALGASCGGCGENTSALGGILQQLSALLQQLMGVFAGGGGGGQQWFQSANGGSAGDPHLNFNGATWNDMNAQPDLLCSNSIPGGYRVSTQVTASAANGVTYNQSATVTMNYGATSVSLDKSGNALISQNGVQLPIASGQTIDLGNGQTVARTANALTVTVNNGTGGTIATTMTSNGQGVDVQNSAQDVDLGGALVNGGGTRPEPLPIRPPRPLPQPLDESPERY